MRKIFLTIAILAVLVTALVFALNSPEPDADQTVLPPAPLSDQEVHEFEAAFAIFTNGTFRVFTGSMYHNQSDKVFIESSNPNIVHIKGSDVTWDDFFKTLPFSVSRECLTTGTGQTFCTNETQTLSFYINGEQDSDALSRRITSGDRLLVSFGSESETEIREQIQRIPAAR